MGALLLPWAREEVTSSVKPSFACCHFRDWSAHALADIAGEELFLHVDLHHLHQDGRVERTSLYMSPHSVRCITEHSRPAINDQHRTTTSLGFAIFNRREWGSTPSMAQVTRQVSGYLCGMKEILSSPAPLPHANTSCSHAYHIRHTEPATGPYMYVKRLAPLKSCQAGQALHNRQVSAFSCCMHAYAMVYMHVLYTCHKFQSIGKVTTWCTVLRATSADGISIWPSNISNVCFSVTLADLLISLRSSTTYNCDPCIQRWHELRSVQSMCIQWSRGL